MKRYTVKDYRFGLQLLTLRKKAALTQGNGMHYNRFLRPGDVLEGAITGLGTQRNTCVVERST